MSDSYGTCTELEKLIGSLKYDFSTIDKFIGDMNRGENNINYSAPSLVTLKKKGLVSTVNSMLRFMDIDKMFANIDNIARLKNHDASRMWISEIHSSINRNINLRKKTIMSLKSSLKNNEPTQKDLYILYDSTKPYADVILSCFNEARGIFYSLI